MGSSILYSGALVQWVACAAATTPPDGRCKKTTLKDASLQYQAPYSNQRLRASPPKKALKKLSVSYRQLVTLIKGNGQLPVVRRIM